MEIAWKLKQLARTVTIVLQQVKVLKYLT